MLFSGDVLFAGSIGRTDLPGGNLADMLKSLRTKVLPLPDTVGVLPGHGPQTTMARERVGQPVSAESGGTAPSGSSAVGLTALRSLCGRLITRSSVSRPKPLSGFPEYAPEARIIEQFVLDRLRETFELHGFASIETRAVEPLDRLAKQGEIDKEVYTVQRLHGENGPADLGLHFDLTVPFARYVLENAHQLAFPFRRYQIQKVWRGERPQEGRYREFTQADIDIVDVERLAPHHDVELPLVTLAALERLHIDLGLPPVLMRVNNRKLAQGFYLGLGIADPGAVLRQVDKIDKIGPDRVVEQLINEVKITEAQARSCVQLAQIRSADASFVDQVRRLGVEHDQLDRGARPAGRGGDHRRPLRALVG